VKGLVAVDTNVLLRAALNEPGLERETKAARAILRSDQSRCLVSSLAVDEFVHALEAHYRLPRVDIAELVRAIMALPAVECARAAIKGALEHFVKHPKLSFADCFLAEDARLAGADRLWTFDRKLASQHGVAELVVWVEGPAPGGGVSSM
jgi:predicted nucleic-acid-binding protein